MSYQLRLPTAVFLGVFIFNTLGWKAGILAFIMSFLGAYFQIFMTPDMDIVERFGNYSLWEVRQRFGLFPSILWARYWWLYGKIAHHRGVVSHTPIISTLLRFIYIMPLVAPLWGIIAYNWDATLYFLFGMAIMDMGHILLDYHLTTRYWYEKLIDLH